ncbi:phosphatase PAP2 family protein [Streptomyces sp. 8L]|uniref:phosphatase PAP2 family protein n=1 Tax=Streptomyces sp. 8L TaxID=2877242 RepID=UPI001CD55472|nr:phosphatase PAP2 family protein [Streptomyces sp. 8L]MCA1219859.1 phosphatase PAP2 family protein [Streptomyces sp. 8L]
MPVHSMITLAYDGSSIDGSLFTIVTGFAHETRWLNTPIDLWTNAGLGVFAVLMVMGWWSARRRGARDMALALSAPVAVITAFAIAEVVKKLVAETRPCYALPHNYFVDTCPVRSDYAFPSGHSTAAFATVAALCLLDRRLSVIAAVFALFEGFTRIYVGAHYPHDVIGSAVLALPVAFVMSWILGRSATATVARLRLGVLHPLLDAQPSGASTVP